MFSNKEMRDLVFMVVAIFVSVLICITTMVSSNIFGIVTSIVLLAMLCVGLGYQYCKNEEKISKMLIKCEKEKPQNEKFVLNADIIEKIIDKSEEV